MDAAMYGMFSTISLSLNIILWIQYHFCQCLCLFLGVSVLVLLRRPGSDRPRYFVLGLYHLIVMIIIIIISISEHLYSALLFWEISSALNALSIYIKKKWF